MEPGAVVFRLCPDGKVDVMSREEFTEPLLASQIQELEKSEGYMKLPQNMKRRVRRLLGTLDGKICMVDSHLVDAVIHGLKERDHINIRFFEMMIVRLREAGSMMTLVSNQDLS